MEPKFQLLGTSVVIDEDVRGVGGQVAVLINRKPSVWKEGDWIYQVRLEDGYEGWWFETQHLTLNGDEDVETK